MTDLQKIIAVHKEANTLLKQHGLDSKGWTFELSNHKSFVGMCYHNRKVIAFSKWMLDSPQEQITDTLLHEIAHALVGPGNGHNWYWKHKAREIGCDPQRVTENAISTAKYNYVIKCPSCDRKWYRYRMKRRNFHARCPDCREQLKIFKLVPKS